MADAPRSATPSAHDAVELVDTITGSLRPIRRAAFGLGSNLGEREEALQGAVDALLESPEIHAAGVSPVYETAPVGGPDQADYLNAVLVVDTTLPPRALLERAHAVEEAYGRDRAREERWGPRPLDIDVLAVGDQVVTGGGDGAGGLVLPHPRAAERGFVLAPWADVDPGFRLPGSRTVRELLDEVAGRGGLQGVRRRPDLALVLP
ncbi:2-amino-4-hydroxy-6-hydroxymethyldihydropteridine diphosphokinase [Vallicoccus soli]|uniref:2-amino-4-hydroxy-6-hydroxymethyldihydropteridine diphosphokinase n=1 Tax=Vallicoccus soli TaxID=2339232 RepID=A0A3A3YYY4_9ACTN|nr:2-amino-4-hydroxy-6-hydroxymethyldihydropteridine diphosphokinase [Vallicoccus soli]RJK96032.1 2-amino-4-hydroxy-6-hydroxymethyldihydropteridine diphosphokinase [Vallicoccus soli]